MDHEVENDINVGAARRERPQAVRLDEARVVDAPARRPHDRVEALRVADAEEASRARGRAGHGGCLRQRGGHRFFDQDRQAAFQARLDDRGVRRGRDGHADRVELPRQVPVGRQRRNAVSGGDGRGTIEVGVHDRLQARLSEGRVDAGVVLSQAADSDDGDAYGTANGVCHRIAVQRITPR